MIEIGKEIVEDDHREKLVRKNLMEITDGETKLLVRGEEIEVVF